MKNKNYEKYVNGFGYVLLAFLFVFLSYRLSQNMDYLLDSDMSSEIILSKLLSEEKNIVSENWFYSTEIRVINTQLVFSLLFLLINDWRMVRISGIVIINLILLLSFVFLAKQLKLKYIPWLSMLIIGATSREYLKFVLLGSYYVPHIAVSFITLGLIVKKNQDDKQINKWLINFILFILAFGEGLGGFRMVVVLYACLFGTTLLTTFIYHYKEIIKKDFNIEELSYRYLKDASICFGISLFGLLIHKLILTKLFSFDNYGTQIYITRHPIQKLLEVLKGWAGLFELNLDSFSEISIDTVLYGIIPIILMLAALIFSVMIIVKNKQREFGDVFITVFFLASSMFVSSIFFISDTEITSRYLLMNFVYVIFVLGVLIKTNKKALSVLFVLCILVFYNTGRFVINLRNDVRNGDLLNIRELLYDNDSRNGYASFWNANVLTELSNAEIEVWDYGFGLDVFNPDRMHEWLQLKEHMVKRPEGKTFLIIDKGLNDINREIEEANSDYLKYEGKRLDLYIFDCNEQLVEKTKLNHD